MGRPLQLGAEIKFDQPAGRRLLSGGARRVAAGGDLEGPHEVGFGDDPNDLALGLGDEEAMMAVAEHEVEELAGALGGEDCRRWRAHKFSDVVLRIGL